MPTPNEIMAMTASLQNDTRRSKFTNEACLPYFNMSLNMLQEEFQLNDIPITYLQSEILNIPAGTTVIGFDTIPALPLDLIEIKELYESVEGQESWVLMTKRFFISPAASIPPVSNFAIWAWVDNTIMVPESLQDNDIKLNYIRSIFTDVTIEDVDDELGVEFKNCKTYLGFMTAALCSMFIGENETRAAALQAQAGASLQISMGISIKGKQPISTRRRPFRANYKYRRGAGIYY